MAFSFSASAADVLKKVDAVIAHINDASFEHASISYKMGEENKEESWGKCNLVDPNHAAILIQEGMRRILSNEDTSEKTEMDSDKVRVELYKQIGSSDVLVCSKEEEKADVIEGTTSFRSINGKLKLVQKIYIEI